MSAAPSGFQPLRTPGKAEGLAKAYAAGVVCSDEWLLHPEPYLAREDWCQGRVALTERRLEAKDPALPVAQVNHFPLDREPTRMLRYPESAHWCGTERTDRLAAERAGAAARAGDGGA